MRARLRSVTLVLVSTGLVLTVVLAATLVWLLVGLGRQPSDDPHGYTGIFGVAALVLLALPGVLMWFALRDLLRRRRSGYAYGLAAGVVGALVAVPLPAWLAAVGLFIGGGLVATGVTGMLLGPGRPAAPQPEA